MSCHHTIWTILLFFVCVVNIWNQIFIKVRYIWHQNLLSNHWLFIKKGVLETLNFKISQKLWLTDSNGNITMILEDYPSIQNVKKKRSNLQKFRVFWGCYRCKNYILGWRKGWIDKEGIAAVWTHQGCHVNTRRSGDRRCHRDPAGGASHARLGGRSREWRGGRWQRWCGDEGGRGKTETEHSSYPGDSEGFSGVFCYALLVIKILSCSML